MSFVFANHGLYTLLTSAISGSTDIRCLVCIDVGTPTTPQLRALDVVSDLTGVGLVEATNTGYSRQDLTGLTIAEDDGGNKVTIVADAPVLAAVDPGGTWKRLVYYIENVSDATRVVIGVDTPTTTLTPNGGEITLPALNVELTDISP